MRAARVVAADADHQRDPPRVGAEREVPLPHGEVGEPAVPGGPLVEPGDRGEAEAAGGRVEVGHVHGCPEWTPRRRLRTQLELVAQIRDQVAGAELGAGYR